jgi:hypothetical protein
MAPDRLGQVVPIVDKTRIVVTFKEWDIAAQHAIIQECGAVDNEQHVAQIRVHIAMVPPDADADWVLAALLARPEVESAHFNMIINKPRMDIKGY